MTAFLTHIRGSRLSRHVHPAPIVAFGLVAALLWPGAASAANLPRAFSCTGGLGEAFTFRTVSGLITRANTPYQVTVTQTSTGTIDSARARLATSRGPSWLHAGYTEWDVTGRNPNHDLFYLSLPPVLPGAGGFFDADLDIEFAGGTLGSWQIPMFDCTVSGGPAGLSHPIGLRSFTCTGGLGEAFTFRTVTGSLTSRNRPYDVTVTETSTGTVDSFHLGKAASLGPSPIHDGFVEWGVTGPNPNHDRFYLNTPPVLPSAGGLFDADLQIDFAGGTQGNWQIPMFDCTVT